MSAERKPTDWRAFTATVRRAEDSDSAHVAIELELPRAARDELELQPGEPVIVDFSGIVRPGFVIADLDRVRLRVSYARELPNSIEVLVARPREAIGSGVVGEPLNRRSKP